ncbi:trigger factor [Pseudohalioglobus lutimaris]|uniref:Trigger factor n=1 Tax=Pseudohalioglobus lutimaris TaxID=1737061 RepID=A0A2N5X346_9GAMM|nr:trigger factor [Pseudohalioglobus lutimaris]PLW68907.1 trigger factor [Pseudohalioglobus lutimaris]
MQVSIETTSGLERRLTVGVPAARVDSEVDERLKKAVKNVRMPGFRPGKVPMKVMRQRYGEGVRQEVLGEVMSQSFQEAVIQEQLRPAGQPSIEPKSLEAGKDLEYIATFEVFPDVEVFEMKDFDVEKPVAVVTEEDIDNIIEVFRKQQGAWQSVERAAIEGDKVNLDYAGTKDGEAFEGGSAEGSDLELGSGRMIPGFEDGIVGMSAGDEKVLELTFPEDYHSEDLQGASVEFKVKVNTIEEMVPAAMDEELFSKYGVEEGGEEQFRKEVGENMARELKNAVEGKVKQQVMDAVIAAHQSVEIPKALIAQEVEALRNQMFQQFGGAAGQDLDLKSLLPDDMFTENAEKRVKLGLVLSELINQFELKADPEKVRSTIEEMASTYQEPEEVINWYYSNQEQLASVESKVLEDQVVEKLLEGAKITEKECSYQDAIAPAAQEA